MGKRGGKTEAEKQFDVELGRRIELSRRRRRITQRAGAGDSCAAGNALRLRSRGSAVRAISPAADREPSQGFSE